MILMENIHIEVLLVAGYVLFLLIVSICMELIAWLSHNHIHHFKTVGFQFHKHINAWQCSEGHYLWLHWIDHERRLARYRAKANVCNKCAVKYLCTDSEEGREIVHPLDTWPRSEIAHFQYGLSLTLIILSCFMLVIELFRHYKHGQNELFILGASFLAAAMIGLRVLAKFRATHVNFSPSKNISLPLTSVAPRNDQFS